MAALAVRRAERKEADGLTIKIGDNRLPIMSVNLPNQQRGRHNAAGIGCVRSRHGA